MNKNRINLYTQEFKPVKTLLSLTHITISLFLALLILVTTLSFSGLRYQSIIAEAKRLDSELSLKQEALAVQESLLANHNPASALVEQVKQLKQTLTIKNALLKELNSRNQETKLGYSPLLTAIAQTDKGALWLTHIYANGNKINLQGETLSSDSVPTWLIQFKQFPALSGLNFTTMQMWRNEDQGLLFSLTSLDPQEKK